jgi:hypothetical protein
MSLLPGTFVIFHLSSRIKLAMQAFISINFDSGEIDHTPLGYSGFQS